MGYFEKGHAERGSSKRGWLVPALIGMGIGIIAVLALIPTVLKTDIMPSLGMNDTSEKAIDGTGSGLDANDYVSVNVSSQITDVVDNVSPAVVGVINIQRKGDYWQQGNQRKAGSGSGVIYKKQDGQAYVITNHHVVQGADSVEIILSNDNRVEAKILGSDLFSDLAVLQMDGSNVNQTMKLGTSANVKVGEPAIAIGNPLGKFLGSVTQGVISGTQRTIPQDFNQDGRADWQTEVIQTDAAINPGNSGGALINIDGRLIGINSMKINEESVEGIGFAIPIDAAKPIVDQLEQNGQVKRPYMGVEIYSLDEVPKTEWDRTLNLPDDVNGGVYVWNTESLSPADKAGIKRLDVITAIDGKQVLNMIDLRKILYQKKEIGDSLDVTFYRDGDKQTTTMTLGKQR
ncbi:serine protease HtrC [Lentibacillus halophilus]|uniref:Serine protease HtrC n=1 Tax=Lentibacillus halophilus TaxID=295065 RepID=A0ABP3J1F3_9BACI